MTDITAIEAIAPEVTLPRSVVATAYKVRYAERALAAKRLPKGTNRKVLARCCGDWLATTFARLVLNEDKTLNVAALEALLTENGVKHEHWNRTTKGWQGRLRMSGRLALQSIVADQGHLLVPDAEPIAAPTAWIIKTQR